MQKEQFLLLKNQKKIIYQFSAIKYQKEGLLCLAQLSASQSQTDIHFMEQREKKQNIQRQQTSQADQRNLAENGYSSNKLRQQPAEKILPNRLFEAFKNHLQLRKQTVRAQLKRWNQQFLEQEKQQRMQIVRNINNNFFDELAQQTVSFLATQSRVHSSTKGKQVSQTNSDLSFFIASLCFLEGEHEQTCCISIEEHADQSTPARSTLENSTKEQINQQKELNLIEDQQKYDPTQESDPSMILLPEIISCTMDLILSKVIYYSLKLNAAKFCRMDYLTLFTQSATNLKILQLCLVPPKHKAVIPLEFRENLIVPLPSDLVTSLAQLLQRKTPQLQSLSLTYGVVDISDAQMEEVCNDLASLTELVSFQLSMKVFKSINEQTVQNLLIFLMQHPKIAIDVSISQLTQIVITEQLTQRLADIITNPNMNLLRCLSFLIPAQENNVFTQMIASKFKQNLFSHAPFLNKWVLFIELPLYLSRLLTLKAFNTEKRWAQIMLMKKIKLLQTFRKEIAWQILDIQEIFLF